MVKKRIVLFIVVLVCCLVVGCVDKEQTPQQLPVEEQQVQTEPVFEGEAVYNSHGYANMCLTIPEGWEYEITEYSPETGNFGIVFRPEGEQVGSLSLICQNGWGVCGTGLEMETDFFGNYEAGVGTYNGDEHWNFIRLRYLPGDYVFLNTGADIWYSQHEKEIEEILNSVVVADGIMSYTQAEEIALEWAQQLETGVYEVARHRFTMDDGVWEILLGAINNTGPDHTIHIFPDSSIKEVVLPQE